MRDTKPDTTLRSVRVRNILAVENRWLVPAILAKLQARSPLVAAQIRLLGGMEEAIGWCQFALLDACRDYEPGKWKLATLVNVSIRHRLARYVRAGSLLGIPADTWSHERWGDRFPSCDGLGQYLVVFDEDVYEPSEWEAYRNRLLPAVDRLNDKRRAVVRLRVWDGLSFRQIARQMGVTNRAVRQMYQRAIEELRWLVGAKVEEQV